jgi:hypothetical protein
MTTEIGLLIGAAEYGGESNLIPITSNLILTTFNLIPITSNLISAADYGEGVGLGPGG